LDRSERLSRTETALSGENNYWNLPFLRQPKEIVSGIVAHIGPGELLAILSSITFAAAQVCTRVGLQSASPLTAALVVNFYVSLGGVLVSLYDGTLLASTWVPILWYMAVGVVGPGIGRLALFIGFNRMGLGRSVTVFSSTPLWSTLIAVIFLAERPSASVVVGTVAIVIGVGLVSVPEDRSLGLKSWLQGALVFPLVASLLYALPPIFAKMAYAVQRTPAVGLAVAFFTADVVLILFKPLMPAIGSYRLDRKGFKMLTLSGIFNVLCSLSLWTAILISKVSTTIPLSRTAPILVLLFSYLFLGKQEMITRRLVVSAFLVVAGGVLVTAFR